MTFEQARRIVEARLYEWGARIKDEPGTPISSVYESPTGPPEGRAGPSQPERWVMSRDDLLAIDRLIKALPRSERRFVELRYAELANWKYICRKLAVSRTEARRIRDRALFALAHMMGLIGGQEEEATEAGQAA